MELRVIQHIGKRETQQDNYFACQGLGEYGPWLALGICDGVGGAKGGAHAARITVNAFSRELVRFATGDRRSLSAFRKRFEKARRKATSQLAFAAAENAELRDAATTVTACVATEGKLFAGNIGDSPLLIGGKGVLWHAWEEHSKAKNLLDRGKLTAEQYKSSPYRSVLVRYISASPATSRNPALGRYRLDSDDSLIACSDGALEAVTLEMLLDELDRPGISAGLDEAMAARADDNATLILATPHIQAATPTDIAAFSTN